jgi:hypothetical protein
MLSDGARTAADGSTAKLSRCARYIPVDQNELTPEEEPNLRKFLIAAVAAFTAFAVVSVATAQTPGATGTVDLKPNKFTKKKK